ncbi:hypothetical protein NSQ45_02055 [Caldifermentibacillus hisashii]|uniref:hypothetical protein n=1 Tax=Caldifermentibacillus hisashii TaxID=996558 RepID=UPI0034D74DC4
MGFVVKIRDFFYPKRRRERISSPKLSISRPKTVTRTSLVVKIEASQTKSGDENGPRRQKSEFFTPKWRRERASSPKTSISHPKVVTRLGFVAKIKLFSTQNGDENGFRRQN